MNQNILIKNHPTAKACGLSENRNKKDMLDAISKRLNLQQGPLTASEKYNPT